MQMNDNDAADPQLRELRHRFRNSLQIINSLVGLHARGITDPIALDAFSDLRSRLAIVSTIFMDLDEEDEPDVELDTFLPRIAHKTANLHPGSAACPLEVDVVPARMDKVRAGLVSQILAEMLMGAYRRCGGPVEVRLAEEGAGRLALSVGGGAAAELVPESAAQKLSDAIIKSMAMTLQATFQPPEAPGGTARLGFDRETE